MQRKHATRALLLAALTVLSVTVGPLGGAVAAAGASGDAGGDVDIVVATKTVSVPADAARSGTFSHAFEGAGTVSLAVDGVEAGRLDVTAASTGTASATATVTDTDSNVADAGQRVGETPGRERQGLAFGPLGILVSGVVLLGLFAAFRYQQR